MITRSAKSRLRFLTVAVGAVPAVKYALGVGSILAIVASVGAFEINTRIGVFVAVVLFLAMALLVLLARLAAARGDALVLPFVVITWSWIISSLGLTLVLFSSVFFQLPLDLRSWNKIKINERPNLPADVVEILKKDCQTLVAGKLLFEPSKTMRAGQSYLVFARLSRGNASNLIYGMTSKEFVIEDTRVSCNVSVSLDSKERNAFIIEKIPEGRKDDQFLEPDNYSQWDWRVTPKTHGTKHLLLYVSPMLYVDSVGERTKEFPQEPHVITITPDYAYETGQLIKDSWAILSVLLVSVLIPFLIWAWNKFNGRKFGKDKQLGFKP